ncbi:MAG: DUF1572 family protein [Bacteroidota bacterium]
MSPQIEQTFLKSSLKVFRQYKALAEKAIDQLSDEQVLRKPNDSSNSIALIVHHMSGNMLSRFTDFLTTDGEKPWRNRDLEFEDSYPDKKTMMAAWEKGWKQVFDTVESLTEEDLSKTIYIRSEGQSVVDALQRQIAHYANHVGQILYQAKILKGDDFKSLTIPKGKSEEFNNRGMK